MNEETDDTLTAENRPAGRLPPAGARSGAGAAHLLR